MFENEPTLEADINAYLRSQSAARNSSPIPPTPDARIADPSTPAGLRQRLQWDFDKANQDYASALLLKKTLTTDEQKTLQRGIADCLREMRG
jgi:hypothetical protein